MLQLQPETSAAMATIVPFVIRRRPAPPACSQKRAATIIIFPGVRYERVQCGKEKATPGVASNGGCKRDA